MGLHEPSFSNYRRFADPTGRLTRIFFLNYFKANPDITLFHPYSLQYLSLAGKNFLRT